MVLWGNTMWKKHVVGLGQNLRLKNFFSENWHVVNFLLENLTRRKKIISKSDALYFFQVKIWRFFFKSKSDALCFFSIQNLTGNEVFITKSCFSNKNKKCRIRRFYGVKWTKTCFFESKNFFKIWPVEKFLIQNLTRCIFLIQNIRRCKPFKSKSDVFYYLCFKTWHVVKFFIQNLLFKSSFQVLAELFSKCYQLPTCWIMTMG